MTRDTRYTRACDLGSEDGAILIQTAIWLFVLTAFTAFVVDQGVVWRSRAEAQNAADAGALAGAIARGFDEPTQNPSANGAAVQSATKAAQANLVAGSVPGVDVTWTCPGFVTAIGRCVRVDVYRDGTHGSSALGVYFAGLLGISSQKVRASASAQARVANASDCLKPWAVPDKWTERRAPSTQFNRYRTNGSLWPNPDIYTPPSTSGPGTGYTVANDLGTQITLREGSGIQPGWYQIIDLPLPGGGWSGNSGSQYRDNIANCNGVAVGIGTYLNTVPGNKTGPTKQGVASLVAQDPGATWNASTKSVDGSCAPACGAISPRIVAIAAYDPDSYQKTDSKNGRVKIVNLLGVFVAGMSGNDVIGYIVMFGGKILTSSSQVGLDSGFGSSTTMVR